MTAVDFSFARYTSAQLKAAGITAVGRYLTGPGKAISEVELAGFLFGGEQVWLIFENSATDASDGFAVGAQYAAEANAALAALGLPLSTPVYFSADQEYLNPADAVPYYQGLASVRPPLTNGCYGEGKLIDLLFEDGLVGFGMQSESDSFPGNATASRNANIWQRPTGAPLAETDNDLILKFDFGQLPRPAAPPVPVRPLKEVNMQCEDPITGGIWTIGADGHVEAEGGAPFLGGLIGNRFNWSSIGSIAGFSARKDGKGEIGYDVAIVLAKANADGTWFDHYTFPRDGSLRTVLEDDEADLAAMKACQPLKSPVLAA